MQPNLKVPQAPYVISPTSRIPRNTVMDASLDALIQQKMREAQYAQQQQAVASRTPTVFFDPLLNLRVRDYYRQKYERSLASEVAGRLVGGVEGAALGAGIAASIAGLAATVAAVFIPTVGEEAVGVSLMSSGISQIVSSVSAKAALAGAIVGGTAGTIASDYSTWYATQDMFRNMWAGQGVGRGLMNTMYFAGQSMDLASTATVVKSSLYSLVSGENITEIVRKAYGLTKEGRTDMDFSLIREALGIDLGGLGNFFFDLSGEISSDLGAVAGIAGGIIRGSKAVNQVYVNVMKEAGQKIVKESVLGSSTGKIFIKNIIENNVDDLMLQIKKLHLSGNLDSTFKITDDMRPIVERYVNQINRAARKSVGVRLGQVFKEIDIVDDWMTHKLWAMGSPVILGGTVLKTLKERNVFSNILVKLFGDESALSIMEFFEGNFAKSHNIKNPISRRSVEKMLRKEHYNFIANSVDDNGYKTFISTIGKSIKSNSARKAFYDALKKDGIKNILDLKNSKNPAIQQYYEKVSKELLDKFNEFEKQLADKNKALKIISNQIVKDGPSVDKLEKAASLQNEINEILSSDDYNWLKFVDTLLNNSEEQMMLSRIVSRLYTFQRKAKAFGKLSEIDQKAFEDTFVTLVDEVSKDNKLAIAFFDEFSYLEEGSGRISKGLKDFIADNLNSSVRKQFDDFYSGKYNQFEKFAKESLPAFKKSFNEQMIKKLQKLNVDVDTLLKDVDRNNIDEVHNKLIKYLEEEDSPIIELDKRTIAGKLQKEINTRKAELFKYQKRFKGFLTENPISYDKAYDYSPISKQSSIKKRLALIEEGMRKVINTELPVAEMEYLKVNILQFIEHLGTDMVEDLDLLSKHINSIMEFMFDVRKNTGKLSRIINNMIPKFLGNIKNIQDTYFDSDLIYYAQYDIAKGLQRIQSYEKELYEIIDTMQKYQDYLIDDFDDNLILKGDLLRHNIKQEYDFIYNILDIMKKRQDKDVSEFFDVFGPIEDMQKMIQLHTDNIMNLLNVHPSKLTKQQYRQLVSSVVALTKLNEQLNANTGVFSKFIEKKVADISKMFDLDETKSSILKELKAIEDDLKTSKNDSQIRAIINDIRKLIDTNEFYGYIDVDKVMEKMEQLQIKQLAVAFDDIGSKTVKTEDALKRVSKRLKYKMKEINSAMKKYFKKNPAIEKKYATLINEFLSGNIKLDSPEIEKIPKELRNILGDYVNIYQMQMTISELQLKYSDFENIYDSLTKYLKDIYKQSDIKYTPYDLVDMQINDYIVGLENKGDFDLENNSIFAEKVASNRYYNEQRLLNTLKLAEASHPTVYKYFINRINSFIKKYYTQGLTKEDEKVFLDLLKELRLVNTQIQTFDKLGLKVVFFRKNNKFVLDSNTPQKYAELIKTILNLSEKDLLHFDSVRNKIKKSIKEIVSDPDSLQKLKKYDLATYKKICQGISDGTKTIDDVASEISQTPILKTIEDKFISNLFDTQGKRTSFVRKAKGINLKKSIKDYSFVVFDTETTGNTSHGVYSIHATRWTYKDGKWQVTEEQSFCLDPSYIESNWKIDEAVDRLNASSSVDYVGSTLNKSKKLRDDALVNGRPVYKSDQEMALDFKAFLGANDILVAHNSAFDFSELMNTMSGGKFMIEGVIDDVAAEEFAKTDFDFTVMDTALLQSYTGLFADTKQLSNSWLGRASGIVDVIETFTDENKNTTYFLNGVEVKEIPNNLKEKVLRFDYDEENNIIKGSFRKDSKSDFGDLHEAKNDVDLMNAWFENGLNKMTEMNVSIKNLDDAQNFFEESLTAQLNSMYTDEFKENLQLFLDSLKDVDISDEPNFIKNIKICLETIQDVSLSYNDRMKAFYELKDIIEGRAYLDYIGSQGYLTRKEFMTRSEEIKDPIPGQGRIKLDIDKETIKGTVKINTRLKQIDDLENQLSDLLKEQSNIQFKLKDKTITEKESLRLKEITDSINNIREQIKQLKSADPSLDTFEEVPNIVKETIQLQDIVNDFVIYNGKVTMDIDKIRNIHNRELIGNLQLNRLYVNLIQSTIFMNDTYIRNLIDLFSGNSNGSLTGNFEAMSQVFKQIMKEPKYHLAFAHIRAIRDDLLNIQSSLTWYNSLIEKADPKMYDTLHNVVNMVQKEKNRGISDEDLAVKIVNYVQSRASTNKFDKIQSQELANELVNNIDKLIIPDNRTINEIYNRCLDEFSALMKFLKQEQGTLGTLKGDTAAFNAEEFLLLIDNAFESMRVPLRGFKAENKLLKLQPFTAREFSKMSEISRETVESLERQGFNFDYNGKAIEFEKDIHRMYPGEAIAWRSKYVPNFNKEHRAGVSLKSKINEMNSANFKPKDGYKSLPYIDISQSRLVSYYEAGARAFGMDLETVINTVYNSNAYKRFDNKTTAMYKELLDTILRMSDEELEHYGFNKLALKQFVSMLYSINDTTFEYMKNGKTLQDNILNTILYNLTHGNYKLFSKEKIKTLFNEEAYEKLNQIRHNGFFRSYFEDSIRLFDDVKSIFTNLDGTYNVDGFMNYLRNHPEYYLVYMNENGKLIRLQHTPQIINEVLSSDDIFVSLMSKSNFSSITNKIQRIELPAPFRWIQENMLRPMKMLSLINLNFMFQNATTATFQNTVSSEGKINYIKAFKYMLDMRRDYSEYENLMLLVTTSPTARKILNGSLYDMDKGWVDLLQDEKFLKALAENKEFDVLKAVKNISSEKLERMKFINEARNTSAARGEVNSITLNNKKSEALIKESQEAEAKLKEKYPDKYQDIIDNLSDYKNYPDYEEIALLSLTVNQRKYQRMTVEELQKLLKDLTDMEDFLDYHEQRRKLLIEKLIQQKETKFWDKVFKQKLISDYFNINERMETIFRLSAMDMYIKEGSTFDEATAEVIKRHFIYHNKSAAEQYAEFVIPFISYPLRMFSLVEELTHDSTTMDVLFWFDKYSWGEEESEHSDYLTKRRARGDIPVGDKLFSLGSPFKEGVLNFQNPGYAINNKLNPLAKPLVDLATGSQYNRWNQLPVISNVSNVSNMIKERSLVANFTNDYYRYERFTNYYKPRVNNKIYGSLYNRMYTKSGYSRILMNMQPLSSSNLKYRVNSIMKYSGPTNVRR